MPSSARTLRKAPSGPYHCSTLSRQHALAHRTKNEEAVHPPRVALHPHPHDVLTLYLPHICSGRQKAGHEPEHDRTERYSKSHSFYEDRTGKRLLVLTARITLRRRLTRSVALKPSTCRDDRALQTTTFSEAMLLKLDHYNLGIRSQSQGRSPCSRSAGSENLHLSDPA